MNPTPSSLQNAKQPAPESLRPADTSPEAWQVYWSRLCELTPCEKTRMAFDMSETMREFALAGIRSRRPDWDEPRVLQEWLRLTVDESTYLDYCRHRGWTP